MPEQLLLFPNDVNDHLPSDVRNLMWELARSFGVEEIVIGCLDSEEDDVNTINCNQE